MNRRDLFRTAAVAPLALPAKAAEREAVIATALEPSPLEKLAASELAAYLEKLCAVRARTVAGGKSGFRLAAGDRARSVLPSSLTSEFDSLPADGYIFSTAGGGLLIAGKSDAAVLYAVYDLLERYGARFFLGGDILPAGRKPFLMMPLNETVRPEMALRGTLPWFNFMMGPTGWALSDYKAYIGQLAKLRYNYINFHFYSYEPFLRFRYQGISYPTPGQTQSGHAATWPASRISVGRDRIPGEYCGMPGGPNPEIAIPRLQQAFEYARSRGLKTGVGIELSVVPVLPRAIPDGDFVGPKPATTSEAITPDNLDPTSASAEAISRARLKALVETYPHADYYTIWYSEHFQYKTLKPEALSPKLRSYYEAHKQRFDYQQWNFSAGSYVMFLCWVELGYRILKELKPDAKVVISGWSIDSMFPGADAILPKDIVFSSLSGYEPQFALSRNAIGQYWKPVKEHARHYNSWWEFDGRCLGLLQPKVKVFDRVFDQAKAAGIDSMLFLHWRTRILDGNARYTALRCWNARLTPEEFYADYARSKFGAQAAPPVTKALLDLEDYERWQLGDRGSYLSGVAFDFGVLPDPVYRLVAAAGISYEGGGRRGDDKNLAEVVKSLQSKDIELPARTLEEVFQPKEGGRGLEDAIRRLSAVAEQLTSAVKLVHAGTESENLGYLLARVQYYVLYLRFYGTVLQSVAALTAAPDSPLKPRVEKSLAILKTANPRTVVAKYAEYVANAGERGVLVSLNRKLIDPVEAVVARLEFISGQLS